MPIVLRRGNVVMVEAFNLNLDTDKTYLYVGEIVAVKDAQTHSLKTNPKQLRSDKATRTAKLLYTMHCGNGEYVRFYNTDIDVLIVVRA